MSSYNKLRKLTQYSKSFERKLIGRQDLEINFLSAFRGFKPVKDTTKDIPDRKETEETCLRLCQIFDIWKIVIQGASGQNL